MRSTDFIDSSNARGRQMKRIKDLKDVVDTYEQDKCQGEHHVGVTIPSPAQAKYSKALYNKILCWACQEKEGVSEK